METGFVPTFIPLVNDSSLYIPDVLYANDAIHHEGSSSAALWYAMLSSMPVASYLPVETYQRTDGLPLASDDVFHASNMPSLAAGGCNVQQELGDTGLPQAATWLQASSNGESFFHAQLFGVDAGTSLMPDGSTCVRPSAASASNPATPNHTSLSSSDCRSTDNESAQEDVTSESVQSAPDPQRVASADMDALEKSSVSAVENADPVEGIVVEDHSASSSPSGDISSEDNAGNNPVHAIYNVHRTARSTRPARKAASKVPKDAYRMKVHPVDAEGVAGVSKPRSKRGKRTSIDDTLIRDRLGKFRKEMFQMMEDTIGEISRQAAEEVSKQVRQKVGDRVAEEMLLIQAEFAS